MLILYGAANDGNSISSAIPIKIYAAGEALKVVNTNTAMTTIWGVTENV